MQESTKTNTCNHHSMVGSGKFTRPSPNIVSSQLTPTFYWQFWRQYEFVWVVYWVIFYQEHCFMMHNFVPICCWEYLVRLYLWHGTWSLPPSLSEKDVKSPNATDLYQRYCLDSLCRLCIEEFWKVIHASTASSKQLESPSHPLLIWNKNTMGENAFTLAELH